MESKGFDVVTNTGEDSLNSSTGRTTFSVILDGHWSELRHSHSGPCHQSVDEESDCKLHPREQRSAGLVIPEQCLQLTLGTRV